MMLAATSTGQSLEDKLQAVKYFISGQGISFIVLKATTSELLGPKRKHLDYLVQMTNEPNVSIPSLVKHLMMRARNLEWSIAFKSLITIHHLMIYGNERFFQNLASSVVNSRSLTQLGLFSDPFTILGYNMSIFVRRYSRYLNIKTKTYRALGTDFCRSESSLKSKNTTTTTIPTATTNNATGGLVIITSSQQTNLTSGQTQPLKLREMSLEQLIKVMPIIQNQFDALLNFDPVIDDLSNGIINAAFAMLYKDFIKLYINYQTAIVRLLEVYFSVTQPKQALQLLDIYKKFLVRMNKVSDFMRVVDGVGMDKIDMPNVSSSPNLSLSVLERHITSLQQSTPRRTTIINNDTAPASAEPSQASVDKYATLVGRPPSSLVRRRSLRSTTNTPVMRQQTSLDVLSPMAERNYKKRAEELRRFDKMMAGFGELSSSESRGGRSGDNDNYDLIEQVDDDDDEQQQQDEVRTTSTPKQQPPAFRAYPNLSDVCKKAEEEDDEKGHDSTFAKISMINNKCPKPDNHAPDLMTDEQPSTTTTTARQIPQDWIPMET